MENHEIDVSVVMPCLNEEATLGTCIQKIKRAFQEHGILGEIVVADNGSTDRSVAIAEGLGARVVHQPKKGYGNAYHKGIEEAKGKFIIIGDSDDTYDFLIINDFIQPLRDGYDFVMGNRFAYKHEKGAMPFLHKYVGNPVLSGILRVLFTVGVRDAHCGMRSFTKEAYRRLNLHTTGMEYASEMVIMAGKKGLKIKEIPIHYYVRKGESKLNTFSDGWRHLKFMLVYSPTYVFLIPGVTLFVFGVAVLAAMAFGPVRIGALQLDLHPMFLGALATILGYQTIIIGLFTKMYTVRINLEEPSRLVRWMGKYFSVERGLLLALLCLLAGFALAIWVVMEWQRSGFGDLYEIRRSLIAMTLLILGFQTVFFSFFLSILSIPTRRKE